MDENLYTSVKYDKIWNFKELINQFITNFSKIVSKDVEKLLDIKKARARRILKKMVE